MHNFRLRWVALGLLIYVQGAICRSTPTLCPTFDPVIKFDDVPSRTVNASAIIEAVVSRTKSVPEMPGRVLVYFRFERIVKGDLKSSIGRDVTTKNSSPLPFTTVVAKYSGSVAKQEEGSAQGCPTPQPPVLPKIRKNEAYFIFVDLSEEFEWSGNESSHNFVELTSNTSVGLAPLILPMSGFPLLATNSVRTDVQRFINCSKCRRLPHVRLHPAEKTEVAGQKVTLHCRVSGKPRIVVTWYKDGEPIVTNSSRITIKTNKRGSQLEIRKTRPEDTGKYGCQAATVMALSSLQWSDVVIVSDEPTTSSPTSLIAPCPRTHKKYCFNGGTCRMLTKMNKIICQCRGDFEGERCKEPRIGLAALGKRRRSARHSHHHHPVPPASWLTSSTTGDRDLQQDYIEDTRQRSDDRRSVSTLSTSGSSQKLTGDHLLLTAISSSASSSSSPSSSLSSSSS